MSLIIVIFTVSLSEDNGFLEFQFLKNTHTQSSNKSNEDTDRVGTIEYKVKI